MGATVIENVVEERLVESASLVESSRDSATRTVELDLIVEGFGNSRDNHYYSAELLERELSKFDGATMYSNHLTAKQEAELDGQPRPWEQIVGRILPGTPHIAVNESGRKVVRGKALISNPLAWQYIEADPEILKVSINARGNARPGMMEGRTAKIVEGIATVRSVDVVSAAGAGGRINRITEAFIEAEAAAVQEESTVDTVDVEEGGFACEECGTKLKERGEQHECKAREAAEVEEGDDELVIEDGDLDDDDLEEGEWEPVEDSDEAVEEGDSDEDEDDDEEEDAEVEEADAELTERAGGRRSKEAQSGRDKTPVHAEFGNKAAGEMAEDEIDGPYQDPDKHPHDEKLKGAAGRPATAKALAANIEAEIETRVEARVDMAVDAALEACEASYMEAIDDLTAAHARTVEAIEQRYIAREQIKESELPASSKAALIKDFHDFFAEARYEGDELVADARKVLSEAVARAIDVKNAEINDFAEGARVTGAGESGGSVPGAGERSKKLSESGERPKTAPLDDQLDDLLGISPGRES